MSDKVQELASSFRKFYGRKYDLAYRLNGRDSGLEHLSVLDEAVGRYPQTTFNEFIRRMKEGRLDGYLDRVPTLPAIAKIFAEIDRNASRNQMAPKIANDTGYEATHKHNDMCLLAALQAGDLKEINRIHSVMDNNDVKKQRNQGGYVKVDKKYSVKRTEITSDGISMLKQYLPKGSGDKINLRPK